MIRSFIAFEIDEDVRNDCISLIFKGKNLYGREVNWVHPDQLHITFLFLGDIEYSDKNTVIDLLHTLSQKLPNIILKDGKLKWNPPFKPHCLWIEYLYINPEFIALRKEFMYLLKKEMPYLKLDNRDFKWHLTLGRVKVQETKKLDISKWSLGEDDFVTTLKMKQISLYQSVLHSFGPNYTNLATFQLK